MTRPDLPRPLSATLSRRYAIPATAAVLVLLACYCVHHLLSAAGVARPWVLTGMALTLLSAWQLILAQWEVPRGGTAAPRVAVLVPVYNEDPQTLAACLAALLRQTVRPEWICVVDDGTDACDYDDIRTWFTAECRSASVTLHWSRQDNHGKRHAQMAGVRRTPLAEAYLTVDSDSVLDPHALESCRRPLSDPRVQSVAGVILSANAGHNLLTRIVDLWTVSAQLTERAAMSRLSSVLVNCGGLALYRAEILRDNAHAYLNETFLGRRVSFSDDSLLTLLALLRGRTVVQSDAFAFCAMPTTLSHHARQQIRWLRGSFIRSLWRLRYLPLRSPGFWLQAIKTLQYALSTLLFAYTVLHVSTWDSRLALWLGATQVLLCYTVALPYLTVDRSDLSPARRAAVYLLAPVAALWVLLPIRLLRWYAIATLGDVRWGTRQHIEAAQLS